VVEEEAAEEEAAEEEVAEEQGQKTGDRQDSSQLEVYAKGQ